RRYDWRPMASPEQTQANVCYRHPKVETAVACSDCGRPICTECMVFGAVGIKCPECAGQPTGMKAATTRARGAAREGAGGIATRALIALTVAGFLLQISDGGIRGVDSSAFREGALFGPLVAEGEWWRLVTAAYLHAGPVHLLLNMLMLWWFGQPLEALLGRARFLGIYAVSILAGSAGALLINPEVPTVGASGAVFGILGAGLILERGGTMVFGGAALMVVAFNVVLSFAIPNISIGGHFGGLAGGALAILALTRFGRAHAAYGRLGLVGVAGLLGIGVLSIAIAYARVRGYA
ncbi:MAG TPA: rhomboid family intramembrane serine protease, partial [Actinomycetota bacterium]|nr:rhomboid family intramembrane serine protease [Actinomycetota bacterium]